MNWKLTKGSKTSQLCDWFVKHGAQGPDPVLPRNPRATKPELSYLWKKPGGLPGSSVCQELQEWEGCLHPGCHEGKKAMGMKHTYMSSPCLSSSLASVSPPCQHQGHLCLLCDLTALREASQRLSPSTPHLSGAASSPG